MFILRCTEIGEPELLTAFKARKTVKLALLTQYHFYSRSNYFLCILTKESEP
jgi:hypothetical protein